MVIRSLRPLGLASSCRGRRAENVVVLSLFVVSQDLVSLGHKMEHELGIRRLIVVLKDLGFSPIDHGPLRRQIFCKPWIQKEILNSTKLCVMNFYFV